MRLTEGWGLEGGSGSEGLPGLSPGSRLRPSTVSHDRTLECQESDNLQRGKINNTNTIPRTGRSSDCYCAGKIIKGQVSGVFIAELRAEYLQRAPISCAVRLL